MKLIDQSAKYLKQEPGLQGLYKQIELAARTCYKSEDMVTNESAEKLVDALISSQHMAMLEHGTVYILYPTYDIACDQDYVKYLENPYSRVNCEGEKIAVTTNFRVIIENDWLADLEFMCEPTSIHVKRYTIRCITNLQVSHELVRHRSMSFAMESSRYCNYSKDKFGKELTFINPCWLDEAEYNELFDSIHSVPLDNNPDKDLIAQYYLYDYFLYAENTYFKLIDKGWKPQQAAQVLPKGLKTEVVMSGFKDEWDYFLDLRLREISGKVHPQMKELATLIADELPCEPSKLPF